MVPAERRTVAARASAGKTRTIKIAQILVNSEPPHARAGVVAILKPSAACQTVVDGHVTWHQSGPMCVGGWGGWQGVCRGWQCR